MKFSNIIVQVINNTKLVSGLVCSVKLLTYHKNDYPLGIFKTNQKGEFFITKEIIEMSIQESDSFFSMDYDSKIENFKGSIEINIENSKDFSTRMKNIEEFFPERMEKIRPVVENCTNNIIKSSFSGIFKLKEFILFDITQLI